MEDIHALTVLMEDEEYIENLEKKLGIIIKKQKPGPKLKN